MTIFSSNAIQFDDISGGVSVRVTDDGFMHALDFISTITSGNRKKASQTLARIVNKADTAAFFTLRCSNNKRNPRKLISLSNACQLLMVLPKRTVCMDTRRAVTAVLVDHCFHAKNCVRNDTVDNEEKTIALRQASLTLNQREAEIEQQRRNLPLDRIGRCIELMERCGPLTDEDLLRFKRAISDEMNRT